MESTYRTVRRKMNNALLVEAADLLKDMKYAKPKFLSKRMNITGSMAAVLMRKLGFVKYCSRSWKRDSDSNGRSERVY